MSRHSELNLKFVCPQRRYRVSVHDTSSLQTLRPVEKDHHTVGGIQCRS